MKSVLKFATFTLLLTTAASCWCAPTKEGLPIPHDLTIEASEARSRQVPILVLFMEESCSYCKTALQDFLLPMQRDPEYKDKVIMRQIDTGSKDQLVGFDGDTTTYKNFSSKHKVSVVPNVMLFDGNGRVLTSLEGLLTVDFYYGFLANAVNESLDKTRSNDRHHDENNKSKH